MKKRAIAGFLGVGLLFGGVGVYAGTFIDQYTTARGTVATVEQEEIHKNLVAIKVDGKQVQTDTWAANGVTYIPLREVSNLLGANVEWNQSTQSAIITSRSTQPTPIPSSGLTQTINGVTVQIDKVVQDSDSLKIYVTYINNTNEEISSAESLSKIVANGTQQEYDGEFNFDRWYDKDVPHADDSLEPGVKEKSVIFFNPVASETINIVVSPEYEDYRFNNILIEK